MTSRLVYESRFGNTAAIARTIAAELETVGPTRMVEAADPAAFDLADVDLLVLGGPTEGHGVSPTLRARLEELPAGTLDGVVAAAFDTRVSWPMWLSGSAARGLAQRLTRLGARLVLPPESFLVTGGKQCGLKDGEFEHARAWGNTLRAALGGAAAPVGVV